jgi:hypothetical protein
MINKPEPEKPETNVIADEILRDRIRKLIDEPKSSSRWAQMTRHPLTATFIGFILSGVIGLILTNYYSEKQRERENQRSENQKKIDRELAAEREHYDASIRAIQSFSKLIYERQTRSMMLASSFRRGASVDEVQERKKEYDKVFVDWNTNLQVNLFMLRDVVKESTYSQFEDYIEFSLAPMFRRIDGCLTEAYDIRFRNKSLRPSSVSQESAQSELDCTQLSDDINASLNCSYAITDSLYQFVTSERPTSSSRKIDLSQDTLDEIEREIQDKCGHE